MFCICCVGIQDQSFNNFQNITMKLKVNETQMSYLCVKNHANLKIQTHIQWVWILKGQVHGSAHARLLKSRFSARTCCIIFASNMIISSVLSKNQSAHSPGRHLHLINLHLHLHLHLSRSLNDRWGATDVATLSLPTSSPGLLP